MKDSLGKPYIDTLILGFSKKMVNSDFSFSKQLDSTNRMKLVSMTVEASPKYYADKKFFYNSHIEFSSFKKTEVENKDELMKYFNIE